MSRQILINTLREYFASKGGFMTAEEYKEAEDAPYRYQIVKRVVGTWPRLKNLVEKTIDVSVPEIVEEPVATVEKIVEVPVEPVEVPVTASTVKAKKFNG